MLPCSSPPPWRQTIEIARFPGGNAEALARRESEHPADGRSIDSHTRPRQGLQRHSTLAQETGHGVDARVHAPRFDARERRLGDACSLGEILLRQTRTQTAITNGVQARSSIPTLVCHAARRDLRVNPIERRRVIEGFPAPPPP